MQKLFDIILITFVFVYSNLSIGQQNTKNLNDMVSNVIMEMYHFNLSKSNSDLTNLETNNLSKNKLYYLKANLQWWHILNGYNDETNQKKCLQYIDKSIEAYNKQTKISLEDKLTLYSAFTLKMRINNLRNSKLKSINTLLKVFDLSKELIKDMPDSEQKDFIKGVYHYFSNYAKENSIIANIFLYNYSGETKKKGLNYLEKTTLAFNPIIRTEAHYLLYKIYSTLENNKQKALENVEWLSMTYPENIFYKTEYYLTLCRNDSIRRALSVKNELLQQINSTTELDDSEKQHYYNLLKCYNN